MEKQVDTLKKQRNRAYAGLHATREELERVKASNGSMQLILSLMGVSMLLLTLFFKSNE